MGTVRPVCLLRGPCTGQDASPVQAGLAPGPPAPPAAAAWPSTAHAARRSRGGLWPRASRCRQVMVFPGRHPRRGQERVPAPRWEWTGPPSPLPAPRSRGRPPRRGPSAPASRRNGTERDGTGRDRTGRDGTGRSSRCSSGFSRPAAARPQALRRERCRRGAGRGQPPFGPGSPGAGATDVPRQCLRRRGAPSPGAAPRAHRTAAHAGPAAPLGLCFPPAWARLRRAPGHPTGVPDLRPRRQTPAREGERGWGLPLPRLQEPSWAIKRRRSPFHGQDQAHPWEPPPRHMRPPPRGLSSSVLG